MTAVSVHGWLASAATLLHAATPFFSTSSSYLHVARAVLLVLLVLLVCCSESRMIYCTQALCGTQACCCLSTFFFLLSSLFACIFVGHLSSTACCTLPHCSSSLVLRINVDHFFNIGLQPFGVQIWQVIGTAVKAKASQASHGEQGCEDNTDLFYIERLKHASKEV